jgi:RHS repeat-associated protein
VKCWGNNDNGRLGDGTTTQRLTPVNVSGLTSGVIAIAAGVRHTCALTSAGGVKCWGLNGNGQLGDGTTTQRTVPVNVSGLTSGVIAISAGELHTCALTSSGEVKCWGNNGNGQLGDGTTTQRLTPVSVLGLTNVVAIAAGNYHTCALTTAGALKCWGNNGHGQLGDGTTNQSLIPVQVSSFTGGATTVMAGIDQSVAQTDGSGMKSWGYNVDGRLGDGTTTQRATPVSVSGLSQNVNSITTGFNHSCALVDGEQKCWGSNSFGQIGDGTTTQRLTPTDVVAGAMATYTYGDSAHKHAVTALSSGETYTYDANGNMIQRVEGGLTYTQAFDIENRLISVAVSGQTTQFVYDGDGNLVKKIKPDGSKTIYVGGVYEEDKTSGGSVTRRVTYYPAAGAMRIDSNVYYISDDMLNSASVVTNSSGAVVGEQRYYPYGEARYASGSMLTDRLFTGQQEMAGLGIYNFGARFYSPKLGKFLSPDSIIPNTAKPQAFNRYSYALNNPVRYNDPTGHWVETALDIAFIGYDIYDIAHNGLNWTNGLSLAADVACAVLPIATGGGLAVRAIAHADDAIKVVSHADDAIRAVKSANKVVDTVKTVKKAVDRADIIKDLSSGTAKSKRIAKAIEKGKIQVNILGDEMFEKAFKHFDPGYTDSVEKIGAFNRGTGIYLRKASKQIFSDAVHEGTHALDVIGGFHGWVWSWERRAYYFERQFQLYKGRSVTFKTLNTMLNHIKINYPKGWY